MVMEKGHENFNVTDVDFLFFLSNRTVCIENLVEVLFCLTSSLLLQVELNSKHERLIDHFFHPQFPWLS